jgi:hypothetical protein
MLDSIITNSEQDINLIQHNRENLIHKQEIKKIKTKKKKNKQKKKKKKK